MYLQILKEEYSTKPGDTAETCRHNEEMLNQAMYKTSEDMETFKSIMNTGFGKKFAEKVMHNVLGGKCSHDDVLRTRDEAFSERYDELKKEFNAAKQKRIKRSLEDICDEIISLGKMAKELGSKSLERKNMPELRNDSRIKEFKFKLGKH